MKLLEDLKGSEADLERFSKENVAEDAAGKDRKEDIAANARSVTSRTIESSLRSISQGSTATASATD